MNTFALRQVPLPVERGLRRLSRSSHQSMNKTAIGLPGKALGVGPEKTKTKTKKVRDVLSAVRTWTKQEYEEFRRNTKQFGRIDKEVWGA